MPLQVFWDDERKTIIRCDSEGSWTWDEYHISLNQIVEMAQSVEQRVDLINLEGTGSAMPPGSPQPHFQRAMRILPDNVGLNVIVSHSFLAKALITLWNKLPGNKLSSGIKLVTTLEEAYAIISKDRASANPVRNH